MFIKNFDSWNKVKKKTDASSSKISLKEGEIRWCRFGLNIGNEAFGKGTAFKRPVLIVKKFSKEVFLGIPLTTKKHEGSWYFTLKSHTQESCVILNQARTLDRKRLEEKIMQIPSHQLHLIRLAYTKLILS